MVVRIASPDSMIFNKYKQLTLLVAASPETRKTLGNREFHNPVVAAISPGTPGAVEHRGI